MRVEVSGLDEVLENLNRYIVDEAIENKALTEAGKITQENIKSEAPVRQGILKKNIKLRRPKEGQVIIHTGGAYHAHLVEFGRSGGSAILKNGRKVTWGPTFPNPFFSRGYEQSKTKAKQAMVDELKKGLGL